MGSFQIAPNPIDPEAADGPIHDLGEAVAN